MSEPVKLIDLEPRFHRYETRPAEGGREYQMKVNDLASAQGMFFLCPACYVTNGHSAVGTHGIVVSFRDRGVSPTQGSHGTDGNPSRWAVSGTGIADLTLDPSIDVGCWHGHIVNGAVK